MGTFDSKQDFVKMEHKILRFWEENQCFEKLRTKNKDNEPFRFLDGPITANNPMGIHHAWGRTIKDTFMRTFFHRLDLHFLNGFNSKQLKAVQDNLAHCCDKSKSCFFQILIVSIQDRVIVVEYRKLFRKAIYIITYYMWT